jgi:uncharacterized protein
VTKTPAAAVLLVALSISSGLAQSDAELAAIYRSGDLARMEEIARTGDVRAEAWMGLMLQHRSRRAEAKEWWTKAAEKGNHWALSSLVRMYLRDGEDEQAAIWLRRGAEAGHPGAQVDYAGLLLTGRGVAQNEQEAARWLAAAAAQGEKHAYLPLAQLYDAETDVRRDPVEAYALAMIAEAVLSASDFEPERRARELRKRLARELSQEGRRAGAVRARTRGSPISPTSRPPSRGIS